MPNFEDINEVDKDDLYPKCAAIKLPYNPKNVKLWFAMLETKMRFLGVKSQFLKLQVVTDRLPPEIASEVAPLMLITEDAATDTCYKQLKTRILELFGPSEEDEFAKAAALILTTTPSQLARSIAEHICDGKG